MFFQNLILTESEHFSGCQGCPQPQGSSSGAAPASGCHLQKCSCSYKHKPLTMRVQLPSALAAAAQAKEAQAECAPFQAERYNTYSHRGLQYLWSVWCCSCAMPNIPRTLKSLCSLWHALCYLKQSYTLLRVSKARLPY